MFIIRTSSDESSLDSFISFKQSLIIVLAKALLHLFNVSFSYLTIYKYYVILIVFVFFR